jgi:hypothetical protein
MKTVSRFFSAMLAVLFLAGAFTATACYVEDVQRGPNGRVYRHARWHDEHVYQHEDGRWYAQRNNTWVVVEDARIE